MSARRRVLGEELQRTRERELAGFGIQIELILVQRLLVGWEEEAIDCQLPVGEFVTTQLNPKCQRRCHQGLMIWLGALQRTRVAIQRHPVPRELYLPEVY